MPGDAQLNVRMPREHLEQIKEAAGRSKVSVTRFVTEPALKVANVVLGGNTELVGTSQVERPAGEAVPKGEAVQKVEEKSVPEPSQVSKVDAYGIVLPPARPQSGAAAMPWQERNALFAAERAYDETVKAIRAKLR